MQRFSDKAQNFAHFWAMFAKGGPELVREYRFEPARRWRFDFAHLPSRVAVEINGNAWSVRGGGRHGKEADLEKLNSAAAAGWRVFQFTPQMLEKNPFECVGLVLNAIRQTEKA